MDWVTPSVKVRSWRNRGPPPSISKNGRSGSNAALNSSDPGGVLNRRRHSSSSFGARAVWSRPIRNCTMAPWKSGRGALMAIIGSLSDGSEICHGAMFVSPLTLRTGIHAVSSRLIRSPPSYPNRRRLICMLPCDKISFPIQHRTLYPCRNRQSPVHPSGCVRTPSMRHHFVAMERLSAIARRLGRTQSHRRSLPAGARQGS